jgi:hypothetical protein
MSTSSISQHCHASTHRPITVHCYGKQEQSYSAARTIMNLTYDLIEKGMEHVTRELGFDAWTRSLSDYEPAFGFVVPEVVYKGESPEMYEFRDTLERYIQAIFRVYYLYAEIEWRESSADPDWPTKSLYEVDQCGSRSRDVVLRHHIFITFRSRNTDARRSPLDPSPASIVWPETNGCPIKWTVEYERRADQNDYYINSV